MAHRDAAVLVATYNRIDDARAGMELFHGVWRDVSLFDPLPIVHAYDGEPEWWPARYLEDELIVIKNERTAYRGAGALLDAGLLAMAERFPNVNYAIVITGDVWLYSPRWVSQVLDEMASQAKRLATAQWRIERFTDRILSSDSSLELLPTDGLACDFFIVDLRWAITWGMFPLRYGEFLDKYADVLNYAQEMPFLERHLAGRYLGAVRAELEVGSELRDPWGSTGPRRARDQLRLMHERPIDPQGQLSPPHKGHWPDIGLVTAEDVAVKRAVVQGNPSLVGPTLNRLRTDPDTRWFNEHSIGRQRI